MLNNFENHFVSFAF